MESLDLTHCYSGAITMPLMEEHECPWISWCWSLVPVCKFMNPVKNHLKTDTHGSRITQQMLLVAQGVDRIEARGLLGRVDPKDNADGN